MNHVTVYCTNNDDGKPDHWSTGFNGDRTAAEQYFLGQQFNIGRDVEDRMVTVHAIDFHPGKDTSP